MKRENRLTALFKELKDKGEKALVTFITAGDPDLESTERLVTALAQNGADIVELGVPFSDPMADGPTIQASSERALESGTTLPKVLKLVKRLRDGGLTIPIVLFGYYNPVFVYGHERFARDAKRAGVDGVLIVDLPPEEASGLAGELKKAGIEFVYLLTPTSDEKRIGLVVEKAGGFIYYVSVTGVTGARKKVASEIKDHVRRIKRFTELPVCVGFGISTPEQARKVSRWADGVVVGSAIVDIIARNRGSKDMVKKVAEFVKSLKEGMRSV